METYGTETSQNTHDVSVSITPGDLAAVWRGQVDHNSFDIWR